MWPARSSERRTRHDSRPDRDGRSGLAGRRRRTPAGRTAAYTWGPDRCEFGSVGPSPPIIRRRAVGSLRKSGAVATGQDVSRIGNYEATTFLQRGAHGLSNRTLDGDPWPAFWCCRRPPVPAPPRGSAARARPRAGPPPTAPASRVATFAPPSRCAPRTAGRTSRAGLLRGGCVGLEVLTGRCRGLAPTSTR